MGQYLTRIDLEALAGTINVQAWADLDNDQDPAKIAARVAAAIAFAEGWLHDRLRGGPYALPLAGMDSFTQAAVNDWIARLARWWLWSQRGVTDPDQGDANYEADRVRVEQELAALLAGTRSLHAVRAAATGPAPFVLV